MELAAETFRLLSDPTRIKVLWALLQGETNVACLAEPAGTSPTAASQHLAKLRMSKLVTGPATGHVHLLPGERRPCARAAGAGAGPQRRIAKPDFVWLA
ncbi:ArsR/SmtB family transcription factor [Actinoplanes couchii]|uniref:HTH arsR-type domain-containing protein n=1 Tax=Actinoplanes couchii TaxID=403638 RepID=A0ABQ3X286_9ACTN|nr:metalloregulator ArsR/SmtB family transcription factor [Actinoplanes couchii]MDR6316969.1 hypothetical protein [Actinoplanes couchii]GID52577.1 hypothetical protein Aco03nite_009810 [Actinoplanes couchii]